MTKTGSEDKALVLSLGSVNADFQVRVERRPEISETLIASDFSRFSGGKAANVAYLARKLGRPAQLFAHVGEDDLAEQALAPLREAGVELSGVKAVHGASTGVSMISVPPDGKKGIVLASNANAQWSEDDAAHISQSIADAPSGSVLVVDCEIPAHVQKQAMQAAQRRGFVIVLDPSPADRVTDALLALASIVVPNAGEAEHMTGITCDKVGSAIRAAHRLKERGAAAACVKLPDGGCVLVAQGAPVHIGLVPVEVVDTTGAGDAFAGAMAVALLEQRSYAEAAKFAVAAAHIAVTRYGSQPAYPDRRELEKMLERLPDAS